MVFSISYRKNMEGNRACTLDPCFEICRRFESNIFLCRLQDVDGMATDSIV